MAFDWKITLKKVGIQTLVVILAGLPAVYGENPYYLALVPVINGVMNIVKHWND